MSGLESTIWTVLGYISMPLIFIVGFIGTSYLSCFLLNSFNKGDTNEEKN